MLTKLPTITPNSTSAISPRRPRSLDRPRGDPVAAGIVDALRRGLTDDDGTRFLMRLPNDQERSQLTRRRQELMDGLAPAPAGENAMLILQLLSGFPSFRAGEGEAEVVAAQYAYVLRTLPLWAIREACDEISSGSLVGDEALGIKPAFAPSAEQVCIVAKRAVRSVERELGEVGEVLAGRVEDQRPRPTREELEARLGRPIGKPASGLPAHFGPPPGDGKHMERVAADIAARKARIESSYPPRAQQSEAAE